jgi:ComF family protein
MVFAAANSLVRILLAPVCAACRRVLSRPLEGSVCGECWMAVPRLAAPLCDLCGDALPFSRGPFRMCGRCLMSPPAFETARSAGVYAGSLRALIHAFKYDRRRTLAAPLASLMRVAGADLLNDADAVVPVPLHPLRVVHRGFNQADDLARHLNLPVWRVLRRTRYGPPQATLPSRDRPANVWHSFRPSVSLSLGAGPGGRHRLRNTTVVLIDDVMTTGATLDACSRVLIEAGAARVRGLTVARAVGQVLVPPPLSPHPSIAPRQ